MTKFHQTIISVVFILFICVLQCDSEELRPEIGVQPLGMSGAAVSYSDEPIGAIWNPANLALTRKGNAIYEISQGGFLLSYNFRKLGSLGFGVLDLNSQDRFMEGESNNPIGTFQYGDNTVMLSYAYDFNRFMLGSNFGLNRTRNANSLWQPNFDIGGITRIKSNLLVGFSLIDMAGTNIPDQNNNILRTFKQQFTFGMTWLPEDYLQLGVDFDTTRSKLRFGTEIDVRWLSLRFGTIADLEKEKPLNWSLGGSINYNNFQINYAYIDNSELRYKHLLSVGFKFGKSEPKIAKHKSKSQNEDISHHKITSEFMSDCNIESVCHRYKVEVPLILAMIKTESNFNPKAVSSSGAVGLTQLMPPTARDLGLKVPKYRSFLYPNTNPRVDERFNPQKNLEAGVRYLSQMLKRYNGNYVLAIAAYNAGPGNVSKDVPLIDETERHIGKVLNHYYSYRNSPQRQQRDLAILDSVLE